MSICARLAAVVADGCAPLPSGEAAELAREALQALSSPDPVLRDELAYRGIGQWIYEGALGRDDCRHRRYPHGKHPRVA